MTPLGLEQGPSPKDEHQSRPRVGATLFCLRQQRRSAVQATVDIEELLKHVARKLNTVLCDELGDEVRGLYICQITEEEQKNGIPTVKSTASTGCLLLVLTEKSSTSCLKPMSRWSMTNLRANLCVSTAT